MKKLKSASMDESVCNPFDSLTDEILFAILDYLEDDPCAPKSFSRVCKAFYFLEARHRQHLRPLSSDLVARMTIRYESITELDLSLCPCVQDATLNSAVSAWKTSLRSINLSRSRLVTNIGLSNLVSNCLGLVEINLSDCTSLTDSAAKAIAEAKNLEKLWLTRCKSITDLGIGCIAVGCRKLRLLSLKWCLRVTVLGVGLIAMKCTELRSLDLSYLPITEKCLPPILQLEHLEELILDDCFGIYDGSLASLKQSCKSLKTLSLSHSKNITHVGLSSLTNGAECLEQLILSYGSTVTTGMANCLRNFQGLQSIKLDGCWVTSSGMIAIANWNGSLKELSLCKCLGIKDECLSVLVQKHRELRKLDVTCCREITYASIDSITNSCSSLTSLKMESCALASKDAFVLIGLRCQSLEELDVTDTKITDEGLKSISGCSRLRMLKLGICVNITDDGVVYIGRGCPKLKELDLYRSSEVTDRGIAAISQGCSALEMLNTAYNDKITDSSLISLSKCKRLKAVEIRGCSRVTSVGMSAIAVGCRQLTMLDIKKCFNINDNGMLPLAQFSHNLKQINLSYCSVTDGGLLSLASGNNLRNMTILHLAGLTPSGLAAALLASRGLRKVKLHVSFRPLLPPSIFKYMEARGCEFQWRDKAFQVDIDPKGWKLHFGRNLGEGP